MNNFFRTGAAVLAVGLVLTGCSQNSDKTAFGASDSGYDSSMSGHKVAGRDNTAATSQDMTSEQVAEVPAVYYFDLNSFVVKGKYRDVIKQHALYLLKNPQAKIRVEGHTDERGSREYNLALGERRAKAVSELLKSEGVSSQQIAVVSYGKELPAVKGHDEDAWKYNRRAKVVYEAK